MKHVVSIAALVFLSLSGCSGEPAAEKRDGSGDTVVPTGSVGGVDMPANNSPGAAIRKAPALQPLVPDDLTDKGLLGSGCTFRSTPASDMLLVVQDQGDALIKYHGRLRRLTTGAPGREAVAAGPTLAGDGVSIVIDRASTVAGSSNDTERQWPATLTMRTADGAERVYVDGSWECGSRPARQAR